MPQIVLTEEQAGILSGSRDDVQVCNHQGEVIGFFKPLSPEEIAIVQEARRRLAKAGPRIPSERVQAMLQRFQEIDKTEGMTREKADDIVHRVMLLDQE